MKTTILLKSIVAAVMLSASASVLLAQTPTPVCPFGQEPGYGRTLSPEQRVQQRAARQQLVAELRQKQARNTITAEEQAWLKLVEQRGGQCLTGTPRGPGAGKGQGPCNGMGQRRGQGLRQGLCDGTGPRSVNGTCPLGNVPKTTGAR